MAHSDWSLFQPLSSERAVAYTNWWVPHSLLYSSVLNAVIGSNCPKFVKNICHMIVSIYLHISVIMAIIQKGNILLNIYQTIIQKPGFSCVALHIGRSLFRSILVSVEWVVDRSHLFFMLDMTWNLILYGLRESDPGQDTRWLPLPPPPPEKKYLIKFLCAWMFRQPREKIGTGIVFKSVSNGALKKQVQV